jgi:2-polyprenyl-3-methyl-5-hydroxy-6-metoxy-1,4-benzoquinol methylase
VLLVCFIIVGISRTAFRQIRARRGSFSEQVCSAGYFTKALADRGYDVIGIESDVGTVATAQERGLYILQGERRATGDLPGPFDAGLLMDVLDHCATRRHRCAGC